MADLYEVLINAELPADLGDAELAELRWHLGLGPEPDDLHIITDCFPVVTTDEDHQLLPENEWEISTYPLLAGRGPADPRIGGILFSDLVRREDPADPGWALSSRQVLHADDSTLLIQLLRWLGERAVGRGGGPACFSCHTRFYEDDLVLRPVSVDGDDLVIHEVTVLQKF